MQTDRTKAKRVNRIEADWDCTGTQGPQLKAELQFETGKFTLEAASGQARHLLSLKVERPWRALLFFENIVRDSLCVYLFGKCLTSLPTEGRLPAIPSSKKQGWQCAARYDNRDHRDAVQHYHNLLLVDCPSIRSHELRCAGVRNWSLGGRSTLAIRRPENVKGSM